MRLQIVLILAFFEACHAPGTDENNAYDRLSDQLYDRIANEAKSNNLESAHQFLDSLNAYASTDTASSSSWHAYKGAIFLYQDLLDSASNHFDTALVLAYATNNPIAIARAEIRKGQYFLYQFRYDSSLLHCLKASKYLGNNQLREKSLLSLQLAFLYHEAGELSLYKKYLLEALDNAIDTEHIGVISNMLARHYRHEKLDSARFYAQKYRDIPGLRFSANKYADSALENFNIGQYQIGIDYMRHALVLYKALGVSYYYGYFRIGTAYLKLNEYDSALYYLDEAISIAQANNDLNGTSNSLFFKSIVLHRERKFEDAYKYLDSSYIYHLKHDSNIFKSNANEIRLGVEKSFFDRELSTLSLSHQLKEASLRKRSATLLVVFIFIVLILVIVVLLLRRKRMQLQLREALLTQRLLRTQMNPHFIYNALTVLQGHIRTGDTVKALTYLINYSRLLRLTLENARDSFVPIKKEIEALDRYLHLHAEDGNFEYRIIWEDMEEDSSILIPPMLLQPIAENSIHHAFVGMSKKGNIWITIKKEHFWVLCTVEDNGRGLDNIEQKDKMSLALTLIAERLNIISRNRKQYKLQIIDKTQMGDRGVKVMITIPFVMKGNKFRS